jgi:hypothetical protein
MIQFVPAPAIICPGAGNTVLPLLGVRPDSDQHVNFDHTFGAPHCAAPLSPEMQDAISRFENLNIGKGGDLIPDQLVQDINLLLSAVRSGPLCHLTIAFRPALQRASIFDEPVVPQLTASILSKADEAVRHGNVELARAAGCLVGMAVADGIGHNYEFLPVQDEPSLQGPYFEFPCAADSSGTFDPRGHLHGRLNRFRIRRGQWTDDTSMAMCLADSILIRGGYDGTSARTWYWNWWFNGLNNAFRLDFDRPSVESIGLGGNIARHSPTAPLKHSTQTLAPARPEFPAHI